VDRIEVLTEQQNLSTTLLIHTAKPATFFEVIKFESDGFDEDDLYDLDIFTDE